MKLEAKIAILAAGCCGLVTAMACFPDVAFTVGTGAGGAGAAASSTSSAASTGSGSHASSSSSSTSASSTSSSSGSDAGTPCTGSDPCDCDGDGDRANTAACNHDGGDCNDHDPDVNSKQTKWFTVQGSNGWDYNCSGHNEYEYTAVLGCSVLCNTTTVAWTSKVPLPDCGVTAQYGVCSAPALCSEALQGSRPQGCH